MRTLGNMTLKMILTVTRVLSNTTVDDSNGGDMLLTMAQVRELIIKKDQSEEGTATVWLTTTEMGFSLTEKPNEIECTKVVRDGKVND
jgi:hypothetical protein